MKKYWLPLPLSSFLQQFAMRRTMSCDDAVLNDHFSVSVRTRGGRDVACYAVSRMVKGVRFEHLTINGNLIHDEMPGKPKWYKTGDMAGIYIGEHVSDVTFVE